MAKKREVGKQRGVCQVCLAFTEIVAVFYNRRVCTKCYDKLEKGSKNEPKAKAKR